MLAEQELFEKTLRAFPFIEQAGSEACEDLRRDGAYLSFETDKFLCMPGDRCTMLPLILSGTIRVYHVGDNGRDVTLFRITSGESCAFSASSIVSSEVVPAYAVVESDVIGVGVPAALLRKWMTENDVCRNYIFELISSHFSNVITVVDAVAFQRLDARVAGYLLKLVASTGTSIEQTHEGIASELGSSREVVSRILQDFKRREIVSLSRGLIAVRDQGQLRGMVGEA